MPRENIGETKDKAHTAWTTVETGIRKYEHVTRKHGKKPDVYYALRFNLKGKRYEEGLGWASQGMTLEKARHALAELRIAKATGQGAVTLQEKRSKADAARKAAVEARQQRDMLRISVAQFWEETYRPRAAAEKALITYKSECVNYYKWLAPTLADMPLRDVGSSHLDAIRSATIKAGKKPDTTRKVLAVFSQMWALAATALGGNIVSGENPCTTLKHGLGVSKSKKAPSNQRQRYLTPKEARDLLKALQIRSPDVHDYAILALYCGLRAGEIHKLVWADVDFHDGKILIRDSKTGIDRYAFMTSEVRDALMPRSQGQTRESLVFPTKEGQQRVYLPNVFERVVKDLGLNEGITDARHKVVFHTLRHTFASWLVQAGTPLYLVAELMGHSTIRMTERYSHNDPEKKKASIKHLEGILNNAKILSFTSVAR